jgi:DNA polymerase III subunit delta
VADLKPAYLVSGDDDVRIDAWRARVRARAEADAGPGALERFDAREAGPEEVAAAAGALTLGGGQRYLLVDEAGAWKAGDLEPLEQALASPAPDTVLVLIVRGKPLARLCKAVEEAGGEIREYAAPKPWKLPGWVAEQAREQGIELDGDAAKTLVARAGNRPARLLRELEKLAAAAHPRTRLASEDVERLAAREAPGGVYDLADALVAGDRTRAVALTERLVAEEPRPGALLFPLVRRLRDVHRASELLDAGLAEQKVAGSLSMPPWAAKRTVAKARTASREAIEETLCALAELERRTRSGEGLNEGTELSLSLARATG